MKIYELDIANIGHFGVHPFGEVDAKTEVVTSKGGVAAKIF